jgi:hypothetical protein
MTNYTAMVERINKAETVEEIRKLERSLDRLYSAGVFTVKEFIKLDEKMVNKSSAWSMAQ